MQAEPNIPTAIVRARSALQTTSAHSRGRSQKRPDFRAMSDEQLRPYLLAQDHDAAVCWCIRASSIIRAAPHRYRIPPAYHDDALQECVIRLFVSFRRLNPSPASGSLHAWTSNICQRACIDLGRKLARQRNAIAAGAASQQQQQRSQAPSPSEALEREFQLSRLRQALLDLQPGADSSADEVAIFKLVLLGELSGREAARTLGIAEASLRQRLSKCKDALRAKLEGNASED